MNICYKVKTFLRFAVGRLIICPIMVVYSPMIFVLSSGTCAEGWEEVKEMFAFAWNGMA